MGLKHLALAVLALALAFTGLTAPASAEGGSTWDRIASEKTLRVGLIPNRPPCQYLLNGEQEGLSIQMGKDLAAALGKAMGADIKIAYVQSTWSTIVLDIQSGHADVFFGMTDSEER